MPNSNQPRSKKTKKPSALLSELVWTNKQDTCPPNSPVSTKLPTYASPPPPRSDPLSFRGDEHVNVPPTCPSLGHLVGVGPRRGRTYTLLCLPACLPVSHPAKSIVAVTYGCLLPCPPAHVRGTALCQTQDEEWLAQNPKLLSSKSSLKVCFNCENEDWLAQDLTSLSSISKISFKVCFNGQNEDWQNLTVLSSKSSLKVCFSAKWRLTCMKLDVTEF